MKNTKLTFINQTLVLSSCYGILTSSTNNLGRKKMKEFVVTAVFTVFFTLVAVSLPSLSQL